MDKISYDQPDSTNFRMYWSYMPKIRILIRMTFSKLCRLPDDVPLHRHHLLYGGADYLLHPLPDLALNNRYVFDDLRRLGASPQFLSREVRNQCEKSSRFPPSWA